ncbi:MAG: TIGR04282 family arsenosugar biosynthesis glycosyltransferase [Thermodesulfobacteriota bacterium]
MLLIFLKYPEPGKVKTRLTQYIGKEKAAHIYSVIAEAIIHHVSKSREYKTIIFFDPPERKSDVENWLPNNDCKFLPQEGNSLGERMANAFSKAFSLGAEKAVIIGTDCMDISNDLISEAFATLDITDVILGPAEDGGYYLLGLKKLIPEIFNYIDWSTDRVLNQTLKTLREKGLRFQLLQTLKDIDTANDLNDELLSKIHERISNQ